MAAPSGKLTEREGEHLGLVARGGEGASLAPRLAVLFGQLLQLRLELRELELLALPAARLTDKHIGKGP